jgi:thiopeptide-type bacteriocin biosynthesis protein
VKYVARMASRATPFGLFAGTAVGRLGRRTDLSVAPRAAGRRRSRLDADYLFAVAGAAGRDPSLRGRLAFRPNSSLYPAGNRWRYVETRPNGTEKSYHLVAVDDGAELRAVLGRAEGGASLAELAAAVVGNDVDPADAEAFVSDLADAQVLVPVMGLVLTGSDSVSGLAATLRGSPETEGVAARLEEAEQGLAALDADGFGVDPGRYRVLASALAGLPVEPDLSRLFQVDLVHPASAPMLGEQVVEEVERGLDVLHRLMLPTGSDLAHFAEAFEERWGQREVPLPEALDEESGLGYPAYAEEDSSPSPLLAGIPFPEAPERTTRWGRRESHLLRLLSIALSEGSNEIVLGNADIEALANPSPVPLPGSFAALVKVAARSQASLDSGDFRVVLESAGGPSGARFLGRFCHADPALAAYVAEHLREEEALEPDAVFAEVVHLPEGRSGNVVRRPLFRDYEIPYLGESGAPLERQLPASDLLVSIRRGEIVLRSRRLGRRVIPRQTAAHNYVSYGPGLYRFLCALQAQSTAGGVLWSWGALSSAPFLPRISRGKTVLSAARWNLVKEELSRLAAASPGTGRFRAVASLRAALRLPRYVLVADLAEELLVDLDSVLSVDAFVHLAKGRDRLELKELLPAPDELCARGDDGRYVHEALLTFVSTLRRKPPEARPAPQTPTVKSLRRSLPPGSEWLYLKLYGGNASLERLLGDRVGPLCSSLVASGAADLWHFVRYADPRPHLRLRLHGDPFLLRDGALPAVLGEAGLLLDEGVAWRAQLDTYEREVERYGGPEGMVLAERAFHLDSEAVVEVLGMLEEGSEGEEERWRLAVLGSDLLLNDLGLSLSDKLILVSDLRRAYGSEHREDGPLRRALGEAARRWGPEVGRLLERDPGAVGPFEPGLRILERRSSLLAPVVEALRALSEEGALRQSLPGIAANLVHMHLNRLLPCAQGRQELVVYELLTRALRSIAARSAAGAG